MKNFPSLQYKLFLFFFFSLIGVIAISNDSLWIDEFMTYKYASASGVKEMFSEIFADKCSETQMPFYVIYMWCYVNIFGDSEFVLRASGLPFFVTGMVLLGLMMWRRLGSFLPFLVAYGISPFIWYYLNEARPYDIQIGLSALIFACLLGLNEKLSGHDELSISSQKACKWWVLILCVGFLMLSGISMLGQLWVGAAILSACVVIPRKRIFWLCGEHKILLIATLTSLLGIGFYYLWTLTIGARAATVEGPNLFSTIYIFYELLGLTGTGPGRFELRESGISAIIPFLGQLIIHSLIIGCILLAGFFQLFLKHQIKTTVKILICLFIPMALIFIAGYVSDFRVLARHFAPLSVVIFFLFSCGIAYLLKRRNKLNVAVLSVFIIAQAGSCLLVRFNDRHKKDDYRLAGMIAKKSLAQGDTVWWNANPTGIHYYQSDKINHILDERFLILLNPTKKNLNNKNSPDLIIASKPDIFDGQMALTEFLKSGEYKRAQEARSFVFWEKSESP